MSANASPKKVAAVVLTHDRLPLLKDCVEGLRKQTRRPDEIIIVNNDSHDGTNEWLAAQPDLTVINQANLGTGGGFYAGIKAAFQKGHDWIWCHDDDSYPLPQALEFLTRCPYFDKDDTGFLASLVLWKDGSVHTMNVMNPVFVKEWMGTVLDERCFGVTSAAWTGMMFSRAAVAKAGYPIKEFFLWSDDSEYSSRISQHFRCFAVLDSKLIHQTKENVGADKQTDPYDTRSMKVRYYYRNAVANGMLAPVSLIRRLKRIAVFVASEFINAKSWGRRLAVLRFSTAGFWFYLKVRKIDVHQ
jgi:GT2 family glycosyltransferase